MEHEVNAVPTVLGIKVEEVLLPLVLYRPLQDGKVVDKFVGLVEDDKLQAFIDRLKEA